MRTPSVAAWASGYGLLQRRRAACAHRWRARRTSSLCSGAPLIGLHLRVRNSRSNQKQLASFNQGNDDGAAGSNKYLILDNSTTCVGQASKVWPKYAKEFEHICRYYGTIPYAGEPHVPLSKPHVERAVGLVQENFSHSSLTKDPLHQLKKQTSA